MSEAKSDETGAPLSMKDGIRSFLRSKTGGASSMRVSKIMGCSS